MKLKKLSQKQLLWVLSIVVGISCGLAAVILKVSIHEINGALLANVAKGNAPLLNRILVYSVLPGVGMLLSLLFVRYIVKDNIGHGVTKVLQAVSKNESKIKRHNMWTSLVASSVTIGFGGSVGAEAPIVYTGAAIGSSLAQRMGLSYKNMTILLGCGAAGAVSGIFNAPLAGMIFTLEILLFNISMSSILPLMFATISASVVSQLSFGSEPMFACNLEPFRMGNLPFYIILGITCAFVSLYFTRGTLAIESKAKKIENPYLKWLIGMLGLGVLIFLFPPLYGEGYGFIESLLKAEDIAGSGLIPAEYLHSPWTIVLFFLLVLLLKIFSMSFTNAGGGVGGTFGPTLFVGAMAGFIVSRSINLIGGPDFIGVPEQNFVLVGMAGCMAGVMQAPLTAIFLIAEITGGYDLLMPLIFTASISFGVNRIFEKYSIYTKRIAAKGELLTHNSDQAVLTLLKIGELVETDFVTIKIDGTLKDLTKAVAASNRNIFPVVDNSGKFQGFVSLESIRKDMFKKELYETQHVFNYMQSAPDYIYENERMDSVMKKFERTDAWNLPVVKEDRTYVGFASKSKIFTFYREQLKVVSHD